MASFLARKLQSRKENSNHTLRRGLFLLILYHGQLLVYLPNCYDREALDQGRVKILDSDVWLRVGETARHWVVVRHFLFYGFSTF